MLRILRHYIHRQTLLQISLDLGLLALLMLAAYVYGTATPLLAIPMVVVGGAFVASGVSARQVHSVAARRVLVYGCGPQAARVGTLLQSAAPHVQLVGYYASPAADQVDQVDQVEQVEQVEQAEAPQRERDAPQPNLFCSSRSLAELVKEQRIQHIVVAERERQANSMALGELLDCRQRGMQVLDLGSHMEQTLGLIHRDTVSTAWLVLGEGFSHNWLRRTSKRLLDLVGATALLALTLPLMLLAALAILLETGAPVLYRQERVGLHGKRFFMLKFRSMRTDAEQDGRARWASPSDTRVTAVGRLLRRHRIDELPQLINVLRGDMSLIGPRPERPGFVATLAEKLPHYNLRHSVSPGITGWAQVRYHYAASLEDAAEKLEYDLYYVKNQCLLLDLVILFDTVGVVLRCKGAL